MILSELIASIQEQIKNAELDARESHALDMNSYGAGYDRGYVDGLKEFLADLQGATP